MTHIKYEHLVAKTHKTLKALGADQAEVRLRETDNFEVYGTAGQLNLVRSVENAILEVTVLKDQKRASTTLNDMNETAIEMALEALMASVAQAEPDSAYAFSDAGTPPTLVIGPQPFNADGTPRMDELRGELAKQLSEFVTQAKVTWPQVMLAEVGGEYRYQNTLLENTNGTRLLEQRGTFEIFSLFNAVDESKSSSFNYAVSCPVALGEPLIENGYWRETIERNGLELNPVAFDGRLEDNVVFSPNCFVDLLGFADDLALSDDAFIQDYSKWKDQLGQRVCDEKLTWLCEPRADHVGAGFGITADGFVAENTAIIENGVLNTYLLSLFAANKTGQQRAKNQGGLYWVKPGDAPFDQMISGIKRGVLIGRLSGGEPSPNGDFSGIAKNSFLIENGKVTYAITEAMTSMNIFDVLSEMAALSQETHNSGTFNAPYMLTHKVLVTGK